MNEIKMKKQLNYSMIHPAEPNGKYRLVQNNSVNKTQTRNEELGKETIDGVRSRTTPYRSAQGENLLKINARHLENVKDIIMSQDARKRILGSLSPLKITNNEHTYK